VFIWQILANMTQVSDVAPGPLVHFNDGGQFLLVKERTQIHINTMYLGRDHWTSESKLTNFLTQSHRYKQDSNQCRLEMRGLMVWNWCLNHSTSDGGPKELIDWLVIYCFTSHLRNFHWYGDIITVAGEGRDLYHATSAVTWGLSFSGLIRRTATFSPLLRHKKGDVENLF
jgi:hypothetical protein